MPIREPPRKEACEGQRNPGKSSSFIPGVRKLPPWGVICLTRRQDASVYVEGLRYGGERTPVRRFVGACVRAFGVRKSTLVGPAGCSRGRVFHGLPGQTEFTALSEDRGWSARNRESRAPSRGSSPSLERSGHVGA